jgi:hypothetical protein
MRTILPEPTAAQHPDNRPASRYQPRHHETLMVSWVRKVQIGWRNP